MWLILLDRSSSMGEPFEGGIRFAGRSKRSDASSKLEAAKEAVREHLAGLGTSSRVVLIAFDNTAEVVYDGISSDAVAIAGALDGIESGGGTDIAAALLRAGKLLQEAPGERTYRALTVTDGKSDLAAAQAAADDLARAGAIIDVLLIDPSETGDAVARAIAVNGLVSAVASAAQLQGQIGTAKAAQDAQHAEAVAFVARHEEERAQLARDKPVEERLAFSAAYPADIAPEGWYAFTIYLHLAAFQAEVQRQILEQAHAGAVVPSISVAHAARRVARGTALTFTPHVEGLEFNPPSATLQWYEDIQDFRFRFRAAPDRTGTSAFGQIEITVGSLPIARLGVSINVRHDAAEVLRPAIRPVHATVYQDVFASYSSEDRVIVQACRAVYWGLGVHLAIDKQTLRAGQEWDPALREIIDKCDLFQLFWSSNASQSRPVREEYLHALEQVPHKQTSFIRPVTWEEPHPRIPEELKRYHFTPLDLAAISRLGGIELSAVPKTPMPPPAPRRARLPVAALPLLPGAAPDTVHAVRDDVSEAVHFLEALTGLRYYPVPTLLVDEHVVKRVRTEQTCDLAPSDPMLDARAMALQELLLALCLQFHVRGFLPEQENSERFDERFGAGRVMPADQFQWLRGACESFPRIADVIAPQWRQAMRALSAIAGKEQLDLALTDFVALMLDLVIEHVAQDNSRELYADQHLGYGLDRNALPEPFAQLFAASGGREDTTRRMHRIAGPPKSFVALLSALRGRIVPLLAPIQALDGMQSEPQAPEADEALRLCSLTSFLVREVLADDSPLLRLTDGLQLDHWINQLLAPTWRRVAQGLVRVGLAAPDAGPTLPSTLEVFLGAVHKALDEGLRWGDFRYTSTFSLPQESWRIVCADIGDQGLSFSGPTTYGGKVEGALEGPFSAFVLMFEAASARLLSLLRSKPRQRSTRQRVFVEVTPTFGIFAPASSASSDEALYRWAAEQGVAQSMTLPGADRVLLSLAARDRFAEGLRATSDEPEEAQRLAAQFQRCVLVHEHFHAILETGIGANGEGVKDRSPGRWHSALRLNESLAVWAELHFVRGDPTMEPLVWDYIRAGAYPDWPYAGASRVEALYNSRGLDGVRELIIELRHTPELAQHNFDR